MTNKSDTVFSDKALLLLFLPIAGELALHYSVGIFDSMMVSSVGEAAVSGVSLMDFVISFFNSLLTALAVGGGVVVGQHIGNMQEKESRPFFCFRFPAWCFVPQPFCFNLLL